MQDNSRKKYYDNNLNNMLEVLGCSHDEKIVKDINDKNTLHPININDFTYDKISKIKKEHSIFSKNIVGASIYVLSEVLYGNRYKIVKKHNKKSI